MIGPGKCDVSTSPLINPALARGLVVRVASMLAGGLPSAVTASRSSVADSATDVQLLPADADRVSWSVFNDSTVTLYLGMGSVAVSLTNYTVQIPAGGYYEPPSAIARISCEVRGIWASDPNTGAARLTSFSQ